MINLIRTFNTVKYMTPQQWYYRFVFIFKNTTSKYGSVKKNTFDRVNPQAFYYKNVFDKRSDYDLRSAEDILNNKFNLIGAEVVSFPKDIDWNLVGNDYRLLCFRLNSFSFLIQLSDAYDAVHNSKYIDKGYQLINDWIKNNTKHPYGDKWNPFVVSQRIVNWIGFTSRYGDMCTSDIQEWIASQAEFLVHNIEYHLGGNHIVAEAKALCFAGEYLCNKKMLNSALKILESEYVKEFYDDGAHFEMSASYHVETTQHYLETAMLLYNNNDPESLVLIKKLQKQFLWLNSILMPNNKIPLVNDSSEDYPMDACNFLACAKNLYNTGIFKVHGSLYSAKWIPTDFIQLKTPLSVTEGVKNACGYIISRSIVNNEEHYLLFDAGNIGPDSNPGHAHADSLNIIWTIGDLPILIDSGVYTYKPGNERNYFRSTAAHNTVEIDGTSSSQIWSAFRVAQRAHTTIESYIDNENSMECSATHDGYAKLLGNDNLLHNRKIRFNKTNGTINIRDTLYGNIHLKHTAKIRFHLSPQCKVRRKSDNSYFINDKYLISSSRQILSEETEISTRFGVKTPAVCLYITYTFDMENTTNTTLSVA